jgi:SAM-dependent methyltransferase
VNWHRAVRLTADLAEHAVAAIGRLAGRRHFDGAYFDRVYASSDPWDFAVSPYEAARREAVLAALPRRRYGSVLEVGCGEGYMTRLLAERADRVVGMDVSGSAVALARTSSPLANVRVIRGDLLGSALPPEARAGGFDLVVCTEVLYYCYRLPIGPACRVARDRLVGWLASGGDLVLQHPRHYPFHRPFDQLCERGLLAGIERRSVALAPRPVSIAVYRRGEGLRHEASRSAVMRRPDARVRRSAEGGRS